MSYEDYYEYGYYIWGVDKDWENWVVDHGTDGAWIPANRTHNIPVIDLADTSQYTAIQSVLDKTGLQYMIMQRAVSIHRGKPEPVIV